tara:strand:- start:74 stop:256 length:183 start_codon:yes stop_codon:yes gene_type:complete
MDDLIVSRIKKASLDSMDHRAWDFLHQMSREELIGFLMKTMTTMQWFVYREEFRDEEEKS